ncbi:COMM domain-containing protein 9-like [Gigantopelta aegis]|uniref:COMM domain-containing protein 9-like n=1 Tax=Gigantopelta aegis TaxID=1735272 RepID=UPI001B88BE17|nr:COMM domain-containing protein 9-like [Gigantopelta aegis]
MPPLDFDCLSLLLKASSKDHVSTVCQDAFLCRNKTVEQLLESTIKSTSENFDVTKNQSRQLLHSLGCLLKLAIFHGSQEPKSIASLFPGEFHKNLRDLLTKIIIDNMDTWKSQSANNLVSLPKMVDFDWRVDVKTSSDAVSRMSVPTCILNVQVQKTPESIHSDSTTESINVELSKETLDTMLDGLSKIREQLSSVANR